jgi:xylulokinase
MAFLGIDIGTSSAKAILVSGDGEVIGRAAESYPIDVAAGAGQVEQDPLDYVQAVRTLISRCRHVAAIDGIGLAGQTPTLVLVDDDLHPIRPAVSWQDTRAGRQAAQLARSLGPAEPLFGTNLPWSASNTPAKIAWLAEYEPAAVAATRWVLQPKDFVGARLTGAPLTDVWSSKGLYNVSTGQPATFLGAIGWPVSSVPPAAAPWAPRGKVDRAGADYFGVPEGIPVSVGWSDALAGMLAVGVFESACSFVLTGTSDIAGHSQPAGASAEPTSLFHIPVNCLPTGLELLFGPTQAGSAALNWVAAATGLTLTDGIAQVSHTDDLAAPTFTPFLAGERAPLWRSDLRATLTGLSTQDGPGALFRAVLAGVACANRHVLETASGGRLPDEPVVLGGSWAHNLTWSRIRAAVLGRPVRIPAEPETSCLGAAMLGAAAADCELSAIVATFRAGDQLLTPSPGDFDRGQRAYDRYLRAVDHALEWANADR